jgi:predicted permease
MAFLMESLRRLRMLLQRRRLERELEEEMDFHLQCKQEDGGGSTGESRLAALRAFGNRTWMTEEARRAWIWPVLEDAAKDAAYAVRILKKSPGFTATAVLALAAGIGSNTAIFSLADRLLLHPYRFRDVDRLVDVDARHISGRNSSTGYAEYQDWRAQNRSFDEMAIQPWIGSATLIGSGEARRVTVCHTTATLFPLLGVSPLIGRVFSADEDRPGASRVVLLSETAWRRQFGGKAGVLGRSFTIGGAPHTVIGVMSANFRFPAMPVCEFWTPLRESGAGGRYQHQYSVWARLKPGVTLEQAQTDMTGIANRLAAAYPATNQGWGIVVRPLREVLADQAGTPVAVLGFTAGFAFLLVCVNVAGLLLARGAARAGEIAIRASLGASRDRLVRQMLTESVLLAALAGALGLWLASAMMGLLAAYGPQSAGLDGLLVLDRRVACFGLGLSLCSALLFGLLPALHASRPGLAPALKAGTGRGGSRSRHRWLSSLVVAEIALSILLLSGAGVLVRGLLRGLSADLGLIPDNLLTFALPLPSEKYSGERCTAFFDELLAKLRRAPGVEAAGAVGTLPMTSGYSGGGFEIEGRPVPTDWMDQSTQFNVATPDYFRAAGIPLLRGRTFDARDRVRSAPVALIDRTFQDTYFPGEDAIGRRIRTRGGAWMAIVGVVGRDPPPTADAVTGAAAVSAAHAGGRPLLGSAPNIRRSRGALRLGAPDGARVGFGPAGAADADYAWGGLGLARGPPHARVRLLGSGGGCAGPGCVRHIRLRRLRSSATPERIRHSDRAGRIAERGAVPGDARRNCAGTGWVDARPAAGNDGRPVVVAAAGMGQTMGSGIVRLGAGSAGRRFGCGELPAGPARGAFGSGRDTAQGVMGFKMFYLNSETRGAALCDVENCHCGPSENATIYLPITASHCLPPSSTNSGTSLSSR